MNNKESGEEERSLGLISTISIGIGGMIGAGIFSIIGVAAEISGKGLPLSFLAGGCIAFFSVYSFAKLAQEYPSAGGPVEFLIRGLGKNFTSGALNILLWIGFIFVLALYARAFGGYGMTFLPDGSAEYWEHILISGIVVLFIMINAIGSRVVGESELGIVAIKVLILILFIAIGLFFIEPSRIAFSNYPEASSLVHGAVIIFVAYEGFGLITNAADDVQNPRKNIPRALYLSVIITIIIYVAIAVTVVGNLSISEIVQAQDHALARAAEPFLGDIGFTIITIAALFSIASAINATLYGATNISYVIARKGQLPRFFDRKMWQHSREGLYITGGLVILLANIIDLRQISMLGSSIFLVIYGVINVGHLLIIRQTSANKVLVWLAVLTCFTSLGFLVYQTFNDNPLTVYLLIGVVLVSFLIELIYTRVTDRELEFTSLTTSLGGKTRTRKRRE